MANRPIQISPGILHDRSKLLIMSHLATEKGPISFTEVQNRTQLTKGNLSSHLQKLEVEVLIKIKKQFVDKKPMTSIEMTAKGRQAFREHLETLQALIQTLKTGGKA